MRDLIEQRKSMLEQQLQVQETMVQQMHANILALRGAIQFAQDLLEKPGLETLTTDDEKLVPFPTAEPAKLLDE